MTTITNNLDILARNLPDYIYDERNSEKITRWINDYCKYLDLLKDNPNNQEYIFKRDCYLSALVLKFLYNINKFYDAFKTFNSYSKEDYISNIYESINVACKYRAWQKNNDYADKYIQQCINSNLIALYYDYKDDRKKSDLPYMSVSIDKPLSSENESTLKDLIPSEDNSKGNMELKECIEKLIQNEYVLEAIIMDVKFFRNNTKNNKHLIKEFRGLNKNYIEYFNQKYDVCKLVVEDYLSKIKKFTFQNFLNKVSAFKKFNFIIIGNFCF